MAEPQDQQVTSKTLALIEAPTPIAPADPPLAQVTDTPSETTKNVLTTIQWLSVINIIVSLVGIYYNAKRSKKALPVLPTLSHVDQLNIIYSANIWQSHKINK